MSLLYRFIVENKFVQYVLSFLQLGTFILSYEWNRYNLAHAV